MSEERVGAVTQGGIPVVELIDRSSEAAMIAAFLRAGLGSPRSADRLRGLLAERTVEVDLVTAPDLSSEPDNRLRADLLSDWYGWPDRGIFEGLPTDAIVWWNGTLPRAGLPRVETIQWVVDEGYVPSRPLGTHHPQSVERMAPGFMGDIVQAVEEGGAIAGPIVISTPARERVVILDGHTRLSALMSLGDRGPSVIRVVVGITERAAEWSEW